jgi:hypothetical protein
VALSLRSRRSRFDDEYDEDDARRLVPLGTIDALMNEGGE